MYIKASAPEAPPLSETTIGCFIRLFFWMAACIIRAIWSEAPPAPAATTISTGLVGSHARAGTPSASIASAAPPYKRKRLRVFAILLSLMFPSAPALWRRFVFMGHCARLYCPFKHKTDAAAKPEG